MTYVENKKEIIHEDDKGNVTKDIIMSSHEIKKNMEPEYIKIYTKMWLEFKGIPREYVQLFLSLATRMTYCNSRKLDESQLVFTCSPIKEAIMEECGWATRSPFQKGLKALCDNGAIKKIRTNVYQINPEYAGKGPWRYNAKLDQGGIENLIAEFDFKNRSVKTNITWNNDDDDDDQNDYFNGFTGNLTENKALFSSDGERLY